MSWAVEVVYHVVMPGDPDENGRCCLNGVRLGEVDVEGAGIDVEVEAALKMEVAGTIGSTVSPFAGGGRLELGLHVNG